MAIEGGPQESPGCWFLFVGLGNAAHNTGKGVLDPVASNNTCRQWRRLDLIASRPVRTRVISPIISWHENSPSYVIAKFLQSMGILVVLIG